MRKIDGKLVEQWKGMPRNKEASDFYDGKIFPAVKDVFVNKHRPEKRYDGLILTVGFSPQPLILSIRLKQRYSSNESKIKQNIPLIRQIFLRLTGRISKAFMIKLGDWQEITGESLKTLLWISPEVKPQWQLVQHLREL